MTILRTRVACCAVIACALLASPRPAGLEAAAQKSSGGEQERGVAEVATRFSDTVSVAKAGAAARPMHVELKQWHLAGQSLPIQVNEQNFYVANLVWGNVSTQIGGTTTVRKPGDYWIVDKGAKMIVTIKKPGEEALIQTFSVNPGR